MACFYTYIAKSSEESWITSGEDIVSQDSTFHQYIAALYWTFETITTVGYGDISASSSYEYIFVCALECIGMGFFAIFVSKITDLLNQEDSLQELKKSHEAKIELFVARIQRYNAQKPMNKDYTKSIQNFFISRWD